jgi:hypothetical protein
VHPGFVEWRVTDASTVRSLGLGDVAVPVAVLLQHLRGRLGVGQGQDSFVINVQPVRVLIVVGVRGIPNTPAASVRYRRRTAYVLSFCWPTLTALGAAAAYSGHSKRRVASAAMCFRTRKYNAECEESGESKHRSPIPGGVRHGE